MNFYTNVAVRGNNVLYRGYKNGKRVHQKCPFSPTLYVNADKKISGFTNIYGKSVEPISFDNVYEARQFIDRYKDVEGYEIYGNNNFVYQYLFNEFPTEVEYDFFKLRIASFDIETSCEGGFPSVDSPTEKVIAITTSMNGKMYVYGLGEFNVSGEGVEYFEFDDEKDLLMAFVDLMKNLDPDIFTGWNIRFFDIPYLVARMNYLEDGWGSSLSPWGKIREMIINRMGKDQKAYNIEGIATLDYLELYRKFTYTNQESYALNHISQVELGDEKMSYSEYETIQEFYTKNFQKFIEYNMKDVALITRLEDKLKLLELAAAMTYSAKVNFEDIFSQVKTWDAIIHHHLLSKKIVVPQKHHVSKDEQYAGAFVKDPLIGMHDWVVSYDLASLYPHLIMQYNISPETQDKNPIWKRGNITPDSILSRNRGETVRTFLDPAEYLTQAKSCNLSIAANGTAFVRDRQGFLPELMEKMYAERKHYKELMIDSQKDLIEIEKELLKSTTEELLSLRRQKEFDVAKYRNFQMARKIQLNSAYGAIGNEYFRFFDVVLAEAITLSGQLSIQWIGESLNRFLNKILDTKGVDYVIASDTDSVYLRLGEVINKSFTGEKDTQKTVDFLDKFSKRVLTPFIEKEFVELAGIMNAYSNKMLMSREVIAEKGVWTAKKRYMLSVWDNEDVRYQEPKIKIMGIETARSSTPAFVRRELKKAVNMILCDTETNLQDFVTRTQGKFNTLTPEEIAFPRSVSNLKKYEDPSLRYKKGTPIAVKAAILYNELVKTKKLGKKYKTIGEGEKMKFLHLKIPNTVADSVIGLISTLPKEFDVDKYIDYDHHFEKSFMQPLTAITNAIGWSPVKQSNLDSLFV